MSSPVPQPIVAEPSIPMVDSPADSGDLRTEFAALVSGAGIFDCSSRNKFSVTGKDRVRWLNGMISNNIRDLAAGRGVYAFVLNPQGKIQGDLYAYQRGESLLVDIAAGQVEKLLPLLKRYIIMDDVKFAETGDELASIHVVGPKSKDVLRAVGVVTPELEALQFAMLESEMTIVRQDYPAVESYELWLAPDKLSALQDALLKAGAQSVGTKALALLRIACGIPEYGVDIRERDLPQETGQDRALNFTKGCYIGQEIVERIRARGTVHRKFSGFYVEGNLPPSGSKIQSEGKDVGEITSAASLPVGEAGLAVALGYIRKEALVPEKAFQAGDAQLRAADLPFQQVFRS